MGYFKKRIAILLSLLLAIPTILGALPTNTLTAKAASQGSMEPVYYQIAKYEYGANGYTRSFSLALEAGQKVDLSSMFYYSNGSRYVRLDTVTGDTYKSKKTSVATISSKGILQAKAKGTTNITIKYKGITETCEVTVVKKNDFGLSAERSALSKAVKALDKAYGGKITSKNRYKVLQAYKDYSKKIQTYQAIDSSGFAKAKSEYGYYSGSTNKLAVPEMLGLGNEVNQALATEAREKNPVGTVQSAMFKIKSVTAKAKSRSFTINIKKKVNDDALFALQYTYSEDDYIEKDDRAVFPITVEDTKTGYKYSGHGIAQKNSTKLTINMDYLKLVKGRKYRLIGLEQWDGPYGWTNGYTFTAS